MKRTWLILIIICMNVGLSAQNQNAKTDAAIVQTYISFQKYYLKHAERFYQFDLYEGLGKEGGPPYRIQWKEVEKYFAFLRKKVPQVGKTYIENERKDFLIYEQSYKKNPEEDLPAGFDYDRWAGGQDAPDFLVEINIHPKNKYEVQYKGNKAILIIIFNKPDYMGDSQESLDQLKHMVIFTKEKGKWLISENITDYDAEYIASLDSK